jgi:hypothetical protein
MGNILDVLSQFCLRPDVPHVLMPPHEDTPCGRLGIAIPQLAVVEGRVRIA